MSSEQRRRSEWPPPFGRLDRMFEEWFRTLPVQRHRGGAWGEEPGEDDLIRVDEYRDDDTLVVRAELPGIDPDRDVELTAVEGMLRIRAERRAEEGSQDRDYARRELRFGRATRSLPLPEGARESDIAATYRDGILEIRIPVAEPPPSEPTRITVNRG